MANVNYAEDLSIGDDYFGSPIARIESYAPKSTYLVLYKFTLEDGTVREIFSDKELG